MVFHAEYDLAAHEPARIAAVTRCSKAVFVRCSGCRYRWWHDSEFGQGDRPPGVDELDDLAYRWFDAA